MLRTSVFVLLLLPTLYRYRGICNNHDILVDNYHNINFQYCSSLPTIQYINILSNEISQYS